jgi:Acetokinase family/XFP N-terminal domain
MTRRQPSRAAPRKDGADPFADLHAYWRAVNYLGAAQIYLQANFLLDAPLRPEHIKPRLNGVDRYHVLIQTVEAAALTNPAVAARGEQVIQRYERKLAEHRAYVIEHGGRILPRLPPGPGTRDRDTEPMKVLALNAGSGSLRARLFAHRAADGRTTESLVREWTVDRVHGRATVEAAERAVAECLPIGIDAIGCRVVHGGDRFAGPARVTPEVLAAIHALSPLAPLHNPTDAAVLDAAARRAPDVPAIAVFGLARSRRRGATDRPGRRRAAPR